jgi:hypothetical protein
VGSAKTQGLPITKQFFAELILEMTSERHAGYTLAVQTRQFFEMHCD